MRLLILVAILGTSVLAQQAEEKVYKAGDPGVTAPKVTHEVNPNYTDEASRRDR